MLRKITAEFPLCYHVGILGISCTYDSTSLEPYSIVLCELFVKNSSSISHYVPL